VFVKLALISVGAWTELPYTASRCKEYVIAPLEHGAITGLTVNAENVTV